MLQPDHPGDGTDVDNVSRTLAPHDGQRSLHQVHDAVEVRRELLLNLGGGHLLEIAEQTVARIVYQDVDASKALRRLIDRRFGLCLGGNVKLEKGDALRRHIGKDLAHLFKISAGRDDAVARAQRRVGDSCSYTATGTRDKPNLAHKHLSSD